MEYNEMSSFKTKLYTKSPKPQNRRTMDIAVELNGAKCNGTKHIVKFLLLHKKEHLSASNIFFSCNMSLARP